MMSGMSFLVAFHQDDDGSYAGFDVEELTSRSGGKLTAILQIKVPKTYVFSLQSRCRESL